MVAGVGWLLLGLIFACCEYTHDRNYKDIIGYIIIGLLGFWFCMAEAGIRGSDFYPMYPYR